MSFLAVALITTFIFGLLFLVAWFCPEIEEDDLIDGPVWVDDYRFIMNIFEYIQTLINTFNELSVVMRKVSDDFKKFYDSQEKHAL